MQQQQNAAWAHGDVIANGIRLHYVEAGRGPLVLLLHGFPDFWYSWRYQILALAAAGFHVVAPDMRGYNLSEKPPGVLAYHIKHLVADTAALLRHFGGERSGCLAGHDWGGLVAWHTAARRPELVQKLAILNAPHPARYLEVLREEPAQRPMSAYVALFQIPWLPELLLTAGAGAATARLMRASMTNPANFTAADARRYRQAITQPGAATAALNYYRAMYRRTLAHGLRERPNVIRAPVLVLWGLKDAALHPANIERESLLRYVPDLRVRTFEAGHFVQMDRPEEVNEELIGFLRNGAQLI